MRHGLDECGARAVAIVDDDVSVRRSVANLLLSLGFQVESFASAEEFLCSAHWGNTGCLVLDLRMPAMGGLELLAELASRGRRVPAVILTAHGDDDARERARRAGAVAFIDKPFRSGALIEAVRSALCG
jgi:FixJ family two-component response regulator